MFQTKGVPLVFFRLHILLTDTVRLAIELLGLLKAATSRGTIWPH